MNTRVQDYPKVEMVYKREAGCRRCLKPSKRVQWVIEGHEHLGAFCYWCAIREAKIVRRNEAEDSRPARQPVDL